MSELTQEPIENKELAGSGDENTISYYEKQLIVLRDEKHPIQMELMDINHKIEQIKSLIKIKTAEYWAAKG